jgi:hypothetical protein
VATSRASLLAAVGIASASTFAFVFYTRSASRLPPAACRPAGDPEEAKLTSPEILRRRLGFRTAITKEKVEIDPSAPSYNPEKLARMVGFQAVFAAEPRNKPWADRVEAELGSLLGDSLQAVVPEVTSARLECRTTLCRVGWTLAPESSKAARRRVEEVVRQVFPGSGQVLGNNGRLVLWQDRRVLADIRDLEAFLPAAKKRIEVMTRFLRSPPGQRTLTQMTSTP